MVEGDLVPARRRVAVAALAAVGAVVLVVFGVAGVAALRRVPEVPGRLGALVAVLAGHVPVLSGQRVARRAVVEVRADPAGAVVARQAVLAVGGFVPLHEGGIDARMAVGADGLVERRPVPGVAIRAGEAAARFRLAMTCQREAGQVVGRAEARLVELGEWTVWPAVLRVAPGTGGRGLHPLQPAVQSVRGLDVVAHACVAVEASVGHGARAPRRRVAGAAVVAELGVAGHAAQRLGPGRRVQRVGAGLGAQLSGAEEPRTHEVGHRAGAEQHDDGDHDPGAPRRSPDAASWSRLRRRRHHVTAAASRSRVPRPCAGSRRRTAPT